MIGPSRTAIILALEPAFAAAVAAVVLGERLTAAGWVGAALILAGHLRGPGRRGGPATHCRGAHSGSLSPAAAAAGAAS